MAICLSLSTRIRQTTVLLMQAMFLHVIIYRYQSFLANISRLHKQLRKPAKLWRCMMRTSGQRMSMQHLVLTCRPLGSPSWQFKSSATDGLLVAGPSGAAMAFAGGMDGFNPASSSVLLIASAYRRSRASMSHPVSVCLACMPRTLMRLGAEASRIMSIQWCRAVCKADRLLPWPEAQSCRQIPHQA